MWPPVKEDRDKRLSWYEQRDHLLKQWDHLPKDDRTYSRNRNRFKPKAKGHHKKIKK